jgi:hypothetical protein
VPLLPLALRSPGHSLDSRDLSFASLYPISKGTPAPVAPPVRAPANLRFSVSLGMVRRLG